jgi:adenine-specific DNA-methyltransferase
MSGKKESIGEPETLDLQSVNVANEKVAAFRDLFPEVLTEGGTVDFDKLKLALGEDVDVGKERYGLTWPGKSECFKTIQAPSLGTLRPCPEESVNWDASENLIIEGDNLEILKLLQKSYLGKVKMIYIDPPYNTGNDFIYPDNYTESMQTYLEYTGQVDAEGKKFSTNTDADGRFHSKWLNMMYPRLYLARNLLRDDGVIFVSIDDNELPQLLGICNELFGEECHVETFVWQSIFRPSNMSRTSRKNAEYVVCYKRNAAFPLEMVERLEDPQGEASLTQNNNRPRTLAFPGAVVDVTLPDGEYAPAVIGEIEVLDPIVVVKGKARAPFRLSGRFKWNQVYLDEEIRKGVTLVIKTESLIPYYRKDYQQTALRPTKIVPRDLVGDVLAANAELNVLVGPGLYDYPKPSSLIRHLIRCAGCSDGDLVLDFFAGSGTTGHAVLELNEADGGDRKFILVQLPEPTEREDYPTIADITKERVRRVIERLNEADESTLPVDGQAPADRGFRVFKLDESNFTTWDAQAPEDAATLADQLELHVDHVRDGRSDQDLLFELLLKSGFPLATPIEEFSLAGNPVYSVLDGALVVSLARAVTQELIDQIADLDPKPERVICLDEGFAGNDQLKVNANETFRTKGIMTFKTV